MSGEAQDYKDARSVEMAIKAAAGTAHKVDPSRKIEDLIRQAHYDRFLCRIFSGGDGSEWVLKGGSGMLARVPNARRTLDIDLFRFGYDKDQALVDLRRLAAVDLGDFFRFVYISHTKTIAGETQPYADGYKVHFDVYLGVKKVDALKVDLSAHETRMRSPHPVEPANRLALPRMVSHPYRLYPLPEQIADKVCASLAVYDGKPSSREKDLVDLVVIALTQTVDADQTRAAIHREARMRRIHLPRAFTLPTSWGRAYTKLARNTSAAGHTIAGARTLTAAFIDPLLTGTVAGTTWNPANRAWADAGT
jgi:hypothetical protein